MRLHFGYTLAAAALFIIEVCIALFVRDSFVRPVLGDVLAVILVYCAVLAVIELPRVFVAAFGFMVGVVVEIMQYLDVLSVFDLQGNAVARVVLGTTFSWGDIVAYAVGAVVALGLDTIWPRRSGPTTKP